MTWKDWVSKADKWIKATQAACGAMGWELGFKQLSDIAFSYFDEPRSECCKRLTADERHELDELYAEAAECNKACKHPKRPRALKQNTALYWAWSVAVRMPAHFLALPEEVVATEVVAEEIVDEVVQQPAVQEHEPKRRRLLDLGTKLLCFGGQVVQGILAGDIPNQQLLPLPGPPPDVPARKRKRDMILDAMRAVAAHAVVDPDNPPGDGAALGTPAFIATACCVVLLNLARSGTNN